MADPDSQWVDVYDSAGRHVGVTKAADIAPLATGTASPLVQVAKADEAQFVYGLAYQAGPDPRIRKGADGGRDFFTEAELEKACWSYLPGGAQVGLFHMDGTETQGVAKIVENGIYRNAVPWLVSDDVSVQKSLAELAAEVERLAGPDDLVVRKGDWGLGAILNGPAWRMHKAGQLNGWSPQGRARRRRAA